MLLIKGLIPFAFMGLGPVGTRVLPLSLPFPHSLHYLNLLLDPDTRMGIRALY